MTKRLILAFVFLSWHLVACSNGDSGISSGLPDKPSAEEDSPGTETISEEMKSENNRRRFIYISQVRCQNRYSLLVQEVYVQ